MLRKLYIEILGEPINLDQKILKEFDWNRDLGHSWILVAKKLSKNFELSQETNDLDLIVIVEAKRDKNYYESLFRSNVRAIKILIIVELTSVNPGQFSRKIRNLFDVILCPSKELCQKYDFIFYEFPNRLTLSKEILYKETSRAKDFSLRFGIIATNKNSLHTDSLYYIRRRVVSKLSTKHRIYVAGERWEDSMQRMLLNDFKNAISLLKEFTIPRLSKLSGFYSIRNSIILGRIDEKYLFFDKIDILLCLENNKFEISEKLFDAVSNRLVTIYCGSKHILDYVDNRYFIYGGDNWRQLRKTLDNITLSKYWEIRQNLNQVLSSKDMISGLSETPFDDITQKILKVSNEL